MEEKILVEPLRDRLYYACDSCLTYIDSRTLIINSEDIPLGMESKPEFINTHKYFILESGDLVPCNDLYNEDYGNDKESVNEEFIITKAVCYMDEIVLHNAARYTNEIKNVYRNEVKR